MINGGEIDSYDEIVDLKAESSDSHYNEKALIADLMDELSNPGPQPAIDMPVPHAIVTFSELEQYLIDTDLTLCLLICIRIV